MLASEAHQHAALAARNHGPTPANDASPRGSVSKVISVRAVERTAKVAGSSEEVMDGVHTLAESAPPAIDRVEFVIRQLRLLGEWAFVDLTPQRPGGGAIEYVYSRYQAARDAGAFDNEVVALVRSTPRGWLVYEYALGATDVAQVTLAKNS